MNESTLFITALVVFLALIFDFINGFHDTANAIATSISSKALPPRVAIMLASAMNLVGALTFTGVAKTIGSKIADPFTLQNGSYIVVAALIAAIIWNLATWYYGIPSSSSHALIGSLAGGVVASAGFQAVNMAGFISILKSLVFSPIFAFIIGYLVMSIIKVLFSRANALKANRRFRILQIFTAAWQAFSHGTNDAQKSMGIITFALIAGGFQQDMEIALWVKVSCAITMALGTSIGGWKIIKTVGTRIIKIEPSNGFAADISSASIILIATIFKLPVSTTHVISSAIMGVGSAKRFHMVKWGTAQKIVTAWLITLPITFIMATLIYHIITLLM
ncbi:MAG: inorganic phosphate transporter [Peptococcaceae bacterium]|nr:inorganic phosphate transporter [Peptococcaceae bacterium]